MTDSITPILAITAMGAVTYATRVAGFMISARIQHIPGPLKTFMDFVPGTIIISIILPQAAAGGLLTLSASLVCLGLSLVFRNMVAVMAGGVVYVSLFRHFLT